MTQILTTIRGKEDLIITDQLNLLKVETLLPSVTISTGTEVAEVEMGIGIRILIEGTMERRVRKEIEGLKEQETMGIITTL